MDKNYIDPQSVAYLVELMRQSRRDCPECGTALTPLRVEGKMVLLGCPGKFCGYSVTADR